MIELDTWVAVGPGCLAADVSGETVILSLDEGAYYGLDVVGTRVWTLLRERRRVREIRDALVAAFDVTTERCEADLLALLEDMARHDLVTTSRGTATAGA
jgi:hypothetical protein